MLTTPILIFAVLVPLLLGIGAGLAWRPWRRGGVVEFVPRLLAVGAATVAAGVAVMVAMAGPASVPPFPPVVAGDWMFYLPIAAALVAGIDLLLPARSAAWVWALRGLLALGISLAVTGAIIVGKWNAVDINWETGEEFAVWSTLDKAMWLILPALAMTALWASSTLQARADGAPMMLGTLSAAVGLSAPVVAVSGSQSLGQGLGAMALVLSVVFVASLRSPRADASRGLPMLVTPLWGGVLLAGLLYTADMRWVYVLLLAIAPLTAWVSRAAPLAVPALKARPVVIGIIALLIAAALPLAAVGMAASTLQEEQAESVEGW